jgi:hypothetical protein
MILENIDNLIEETSTSIEVKKKAVKIFKKTKGDESKMSIADKAFWGTVLSLAGLTAYAHIKTEEALQNVLNNITPEILNNIPL